MKGKLNKKEELEHFHDWLSFKPNLSNKDIKNKNYKITDDDKTEYLISLKKYGKRKLCKSQYKIDKKIQS